MSKIGRYEDNPCDSCSAEVPTEIYRMGLGEKQKRLCEFCANTFVGTAYEYPEQYPILREIGPTLSLMYWMLKGKM